MQNLDPKAVQYANEALWRQYPELNRRQLVMPQDAKYATEWTKHYKAYKASQIAPPAPAAPQPAPVNTVQPCVASAPCGMNSLECTTALTTGRDKDGHIIPTNLHDRLVATHATIRSRMALAKALGYERAVDALDHWMNGCGKFKEMPADKAKETRDEAWDRHREMLKPRLQSGLRTRLAYDLLKTNQAPSLTLVMQWKGGGKSMALVPTDDNLAYFGATIHSRVSYECTLSRVGSSAAPAEKRPFCYQCKAVEWISWAEDNYDFESGKATPGLPSDADMNVLAQYGCGANYQRSSTSWSTTPHEHSQEICFANRDELLRAATDRHFRMEQEVLEEAEERARGALKSAGPAEEMMGKPAPAP